MMRGDEKLVTSPKVLLVMPVVGLFQLAWFMMLKKSARASSFQRSRIAKRRETAISQLIWPGP